MQPFILHRPSVPSAFMTLYIFLFSFLSVKSQGITSPDFKVDSITALIPAGDINGDGYNDVFAHHEITQAYPPGTFNVYIYYGSPQGLSTHPDTTIIQIGPNQVYRGLAISPSGTPVGDVNGDGFDDMYFDYKGDDNSHVGYIHFGSAQGLNPVGAWHWNYVSYSNFRGAAVGDVNKDGFDDFIINLQEVNTSYLFYGSASLPSAEPGWSYINYEPENLRTSIVVKAGDVNGDGFDDVLVWGQFSESLVFLGSPSGLNTEPDWKFPARTPTNKGRMVAPAGDINHDGFDDILFRDHVDPITFEEKNITYYFLGSDTGIVNSPVILPWLIFEVGDINGDHISDYGIHDSTMGLQNIPDYLDPILKIHCGTLDGKPSNIPIMRFKKVVVSFPHYFSAIAGDLNGDNTGDIVGTHFPLGYAFGLYHNGYVYYGKKSSIRASIPDVYAVNPGGEPNTIYLGYGPSTLRLNVNITSGKPPYTYLWATGETTSYINVSPKIPGTYTYAVQVNDARGNPITLTKKVKVIDIRCGTRKVSICLSSNHFGQYSACINVHAVNQFLKRGATLGKCFSEGKPEKPKSILVVFVYPNPSRGIFRFTILGNDRQQPVQLKITDMNGKIVQITRNIKPNTTIEAGQNLRPGIYIAEISQGTNRRTIKLIKVQ